MASCVRNISTKNYQNLVIGFQVTVENVGVVFLDTVYFATNVGACDVGGQDEERRRVWVGGFSLKTTSGRVAVMWLVLRWVIVCGQETV